MACADTRWDADVDEVAYDAGIARLDRAVFSIDPDRASLDCADLAADYGTVYADYIEDIMRIGEAGNPMSASLLLRFTTDPVWEGLQREVDQVFPGLQLFEQELELGLKRYAVFFNEQKLPRLVAYNSGFNVGVYPSDEWLGVGLEWYAGSDHKVVKQLPPDLFPQYKRDKMRPEYMVPNMIRGWAMYRFQNLSTEEDLLSEMIFAGKMVFVTKVLLQLQDEMRVMNYSQDQMDWCRNKEYDIWKNLVERDLIFSKDLMEINKLINDGPFTPGMPPESPGGVGRWVGYRMVEAFAKKNPDLSLGEIVRYQDHRQFLKHYKPGR